MKDVKKKRKNDSIMKDNKERVKMKEERIEEKKVIEISKCRKINKKRIKEKNSKNTYIDIPKEGR